MILMRASGNIHHKGQWKGWALKIDFLGPWNGNERNIHHKGQWKGWALKIDFLGPWNGNEQSSKSNLKNFSLSPEAD